MADYPPALITAQQAATAAWAAVEAHRRAVDARRGAEAVDGTLPPWAPKQDAEHARLMA